MKTNNLSQIVAGYVAAALWSSMYENQQGETNFMDRKFSVENIHPDTLAKMTETCNKFLEENRELIDAESVEERQVGHDLWLTRNGHGTGFWDRPEVYGEENAKKLTDAAHKLGECNLYVGDDEKIHLM